MGRHRRGRLLHGARPGHGLDLAPFSSPAHARPDLQPGRPHGAAALSAPLRRARAWNRCPRAMAREGPKHGAGLAPGAARAPGLPGPLLPYPVVLRRVPREPGGRQRPLCRRPFFRLFQPARQLDERILARHERPRHRFAAGGSPLLRDPLIPVGPFVRKLDGQGEAMTRRSAYLFLLLSVPALAWGHIGSPAVFFEGSAGAFPVRVVIRPPGAVPGLAEVSVRVQGGGVRRVTVLPVFWETGRKGAPPPDEARPVRGDSSLYSAELWLMRTGPYSVFIDVEGDRGSGTAIVPLNSVALERLELPWW